ncbi:MAG: hypothetical protein IPM23_11840 [Candidatus Melainabacteria bacterium]|nr:hypothetical protein [Candidatus Melainabacteria bacterium]
MPKDKIPSPEKLESAALCLAVLDIIFGEGEPVFYCEPGFQKEGVNASFMDNREGGQWSLRVSKNGSVLKGVHRDAFMYPGGEPPFKTEINHGFKTYPGVLAGFPERLAYLLSDPDPFVDLTFCVWSGSRTSSWESGAFFYPENVDDPDASEELLAFLINPVDSYIELCRDLYGTNIADREAVQAIAGGATLTPSLLKRLRPDCSLLAIRHRLEQIGYPYSLKEPQVNEQSRSGKSDEHLLDTDSTITETAIGALRGLSGFLADSGLASVKDRAGDIAQSGLAAAISGLSSVIAPDPPESPMAREPLFKWWRPLESRLKLSKRDGMHARIGFIVAELVDRYHYGREECFNKFVLDMEESFESMPDFLMGAFSDLARIYGERDFKEDAELLRRKAALWRQNFIEAGSHPTGDRDLPRILVYVPLSDRGFNLDVLFADITTALTNKGAPYNMISSRGRFPQKDEREFGLIAIDAPPGVLTEIAPVLFDLLAGKRLPAGSYLIDPQGERREISIDL